MLQPTKSLSKEQEFHIIVKMLKEWHDSNNVGMAIDNYFKLVQLVRDVYYTLKQSLQEAEKHQQQLHNTISKLDIQLNGVLQQNFDLKQSLERVRQKKRELQNELEQSSIMYIREIEQLSVDQSITENLQKDKQQLEQTLKNRQSQFESLQANYFHLTMQLTQRTEKQKKLRRTYDQLKSQRDAQKTQKEVLQLKNEQLKQQVQYLKNLIDNKREFLLKFVNNEKVQSESNIGQKSFLQSQEGQFQRYADRLELQQFDPSYAQYSQSQKSNYLSKNHHEEDQSSKKSSDYAPRKAPKDPYITPQIQRRSSMKKQIHSSYHERLATQYESKFISLPAYADKAYKNFQDQLLNFESSQSSSSKLQINAPSYQDHALKVSLSKQNCLIKILKQEIKQLKRKNLNKIALPRRRDLHIDDVTELSWQLQSMNSKIKESRKQIFELKTQKQYFELLCQSMQNQRILKEKAYKNLLLEKMKELFHSERVKYHQKQEKLKGELYKLKNQLKKNKQQHYSQSKGKFNSLIQNFTPLDMTNFNAPEGMNTSRHNLSDDEEQYDDQEVDKKDFIVRGNLDVSSDFLQAEQKQVSSNQSGQQDHHGDDLSFQSNQSKKSHNAYAQTDEIFMFSDQEQYIAQGFRNFYFAQQQQVQTQRYSDERQDVGIQVLFCEQSYTQTDKTGFIDTLQYTQQTFQNQEKYSQTQQISYAGKLKNTLFQNKTNSLSEDFQQVQNDSFAHPEIYQTISANQQGLNFILRNQQQIDEKMMDFIKVIDDKSTLISKESNRKSILRIDLCLQQQPTFEHSSQTQRKLFKAPDKQSFEPEIKTQRKVSCNLKISRQVIWQLNDGSIQPKIMENSNSVSNKSLYDKNLQILPLEQSQMVSISCQTENCLNQDYGVQVCSTQSSQKSTFQKSNHENNHEENINKLEQSICSNPSLFKNLNVAISSTNNSFSSALRNLKLQSECDQSFKKQKLSRIRNKKISQKPFENRSHTRARSKSNLEEHPSKHQNYANFEIEEELYRLDSSRYVEANPIEEKQVKQQQFDYSNIKEQLRQIPWNDVYKWSSINPMNIVSSDDLDPGKWNNKLCYIFDAVDSSGYQSTFFVCKRGVYCTTTKNTLRLEKRGIFCRQPGIFSLGNSELTLIKSQMLIRKKKDQSGCLVGDIQNGNWKINLRTRKCFKIND